VRSRVCSYLPARLVIAARAGFRAVRGVGSGSPKGRTKLQTRHSYRDHDDRAFTNEQAPNTGSLHECTSQVRGGNGPDESSPTISVLAFRPRGPRSRSSVSSVNASMPSGQLPVRNCFTS
jgi:hypothetical protein